MIFSIMIWINMILDQASTAVTVVGWIQFGLLTLLIGIPLLLMFIVLIVPFRYDLKGVLCEAKEFEDDEAESEDEPGGPGDTIKKMILEWVYKVTDPIEGIGKFSWFLGMVKGEMFYKDRELSWKAKILFKKISSEKLGSQEEKDKGEEEKVDTVNQEENRNKEESINTNIQDKNKSNEKASYQEGNKEGKLTLKYQEKKESEPEKDLSKNVEVDSKKKPSASLENRQEKASVSQKIEKSDEDHVKNRDKGKDEDKDKDKDKYKNKEISKDIENNEYKEDREQGEDDKSILEKIQEFFERLSEGFEHITEKIEYTYELICDKIDLASEMKDKISNFISYETHQEAYDKLKIELKKLWRAVKPTKIKGRMKVGFENPMTTGLVVAGASLLRPYTNGNAQIEADFDDQVLEGELQIKGKLRLGSLVWFALRMYINRSVQVTIRNAIKFVNKNMNMIKKESIKDI